MSHHRFLSTDAEVRIALKGLCHAILVSFKKLKSVLASIEFKNNGLVLLLRTI